MIVCRNTGLYRHTVCERFDRYSQRQEKVVLFQCLVYLKRHSTRPDPTRLEGRLAQLQKSCDKRPNDRNKLVVGIRHQIKPLIIPTDNAGVAAESHTQCSWPLTWPSDLYDATGTWAGDPSTPTGRPTCRADIPPSVGPTVGTTVGWTFHRLRNLLYGRRLNGKRRAARDYRGTDTSWDPQRQHRAGRVGLVSRGPRPIYVV